MRDELKKMLGNFAAMLAVSFVVLGCSSANTTAVIAETPIVSPQFQGQMLPVEATVMLGGETIELEVARTAREQSLGLMYRDRLPDNRGMIFPFVQAQEVGFWMKNVPVALDMVFVREGIVRAIVTAPPCGADPCPTYGPAEAIDAVIELREGRAEELGLKVGDRAIVQWSQPVR